MSLKILCSIYYVTNYKINKLSQVSELRVFQFFKSYLTSHKISVDQGFKFHCGACHPSPSRAWNCPCRAPHYSTMPQDLRGAELMSCFPVIFKHIIVNHCNFNISYCYTEQYVKQTTDVLILLLQQAEITFIPLPLQETGAALPQPTQII